MISRQRTENLWVELSAAFDVSLREGVRATDAMYAIVRFRDALMLGLTESSTGLVELHMRMSLFVHGGRTLADASIRGRSTITFLRMIRRGGFRFTTGASADSIAQLVGLACNLEQGVVSAKNPEFERNLAAIEGIECLDPLDDIRWDCVNEASTTTAYSTAGFDLEMAEPTRLEIATAVEDAVDAAGDGNSVDLNVARTASETVVQAAEFGFDNLMQLAERPEFDVFTVQHSLRVSLLTSYVASQMGVPREANIEMTAAAMFHDVGKGRIPESILYKPGRLDEDERRIMAMHPELGAEILVESQNTSSYALGAAWGHHLRFDGRGYPSRRHWFQPSRVTSLIQICDVFEALTSRRPYKSPYTPARAFQILYSDPGAFDPGLLAAFTRALGLFPPGRFVSLSDGRLGRVAQVGQRVDRPTVRTFPDGDLVVLDDPESHELRVAELIEEPEFVRRLREETAPGEREAEEAEAVENASTEGPRDDEYVGLSAGNDVADDCGHDGDCRLC